MAPVPRWELPVVVDCEIDGEDGAADAGKVAAEVPGREEDFEIEKVEGATDSVEAPDVSRDAEMDVWGTADGEGVGAASTPWLHVTASDCGELSTLKIGPRILWALPSEA